jgi:hypothetical protein
MIKETKPRMGRPRVYTDAERTARAVTHAKRTKKKYRNTTISIRGEDLERLNALKEAESERLGFSLTHQQFYKLLFKNWEENHKK